MNRVTLGVLATFVVILLGSGLIAYVFRDRSGAATTFEAPSGPSASAPATQSPEGHLKRESPLLWEIFGPDASGLLPSNYATWQSTAARIALRFSLAAFLA